MCAVVVVLNESSCVCGVSVFFFFFKQKTAYEMRISDWSSDVCSSDLAFLHRHDDAVLDGDRATKARLRRHHLGIGEAQRDARFRRRLSIQKLFLQHHITRSASRHTVFTKGCPSTTATRTRSARSPGAMRPRSVSRAVSAGRDATAAPRSEEHTSALQSLMRTTD